MIYLSVGLAIAGFTVGLWLFRVVPVAEAIVATSRSSFSILRDPSLDDNAKEAAMQKASLQLFGKFASILLRSVGAILVSILPPAALHFAGLVKFESTLEALASWPAIVGATVIMTGAYLLTRAR